MTPPAVEARSLSRAFGTRASLARAGTAILLTTHLFEEAEAAHRIARLAAQSPPETR